MHYGEPNLNEGKPWSEMDLFDLKHGLKRGHPVEELADFLCRSEKEIREKLAELERLPWTQIAMGVSSGRQSRS